MSLKEEKARVAEPMRCFRELYLIISQTAAADIFIKERREPVKTMSFQAYRQPSTLKDG